MINLYQNYYEESNLLRRKELDHCRSCNIQNPKLNVQQIKSNKRLTFTDFFQAINKITKPDDINVIANLDIIFDDSIDLAKNMHYNDFYCLTRYDLINNEPVFYNRAVSQDVWIWKGEIKGVFGDFELGQLGCDNKLAFEARKATYNVSNPSLSIKTYHLHESGFRNYKKEDVIAGPYLHLEPVFLSSKVLF